MKRFKTDYPGVFFRETARIGGKGIEKCYYTSQGHKFNFFYIIKCLKSEGQKRIKFSFV